ncbi:hypothetical protein SCHPADRAFT_934058 [Schizopora paradoxa]|uniref:Uncharacterized protein n=1 Tax=Schizopora paradoxa TaxID=27342 RepID=A0A0H2QXE3_9AGAM|nr:hypothetical protein SCHPADRAFT_934058 [Schizopora paradoxa]
MPAPRIAARPKADRKTNHDPKRPVRIPAPPPGHARRSHRRVPPSRSLSSPPPSSPARSSLKQRREKLYVGVIRPFLVLIGARSRHERGNVEKGVQHAMLNPLSDLIPRPFTKGNLAIYLAFLPKGYPWGPSERTPAFKRSINLLLTHRSFRFFALPGPKNSVWCIRIGHRQPFLPGISL